MLSKSKGQILRVAACLQTLFGLQAENGELEPSGAAEVIHISEDAIEAAINFVEVCLQHTAYIAGRGLISDEIRILTTGTYIDIHNKSVCVHTINTWQLSAEIRYLLVFFRFII